jgi:murein DD-endopeptidase MepM/ murein hydrolase activator NlpD
MRIIFLAALFVTLMATACLPVDKPVDEVFLPTSSSTSTPPEQEANTLAFETSFTDVPVLQTETPLITEEPQSGVIELFCEDNYCNYFWPGWLERPIGADGIQMIDRSYPYGSRGDSDDLDLHYGVEFLNRHGTPVFAAQTGDVVFAGTDDTVKLSPFFAYYGNVVILRHSGLLETGQDVYTLYAHLSEINVREGKQVAVGDEIGKVGASGSAYGPHLHFEVRLNDINYANTVNPMLWFAPLKENDHPQLATLSGVVLDRDGNPVSKLTLTLEKLSASGEVEAYYYPVTYYPTGLNSHPLLNENFVFPDIPAGEYRLGLIAGRYHEYFFLLEPGSVGFIEIQLD